MNAINRFHMQIGWLVNEQLSIQPFVHISAMVLVPQYFHTQHSLLLLNLNIQPTSNLCGTILLLVIRQNKALHYLLPLSVIFIDQSILFAYFRKFKKGTSIHDHFDPQFSECRQLHRGELYASVMRTKWSTNR